MQRLHRWTQLTLVCWAAGSCGGSADSVTGTVPPPSVASVAVIVGSVNLIVGANTQASATLKDASGNVLTGRTVSWSTNSVDVATVTPAGLVTAVAAGSVAITATSEGQSGSAGVTVTPVPVASVSVSLAASTLTVGATTQATATLKDANGNVLTGRGVIWASSNTTVATVSTSGVVTAVSAGTASITASSEGQSGSVGVRLLQCLWPR